MDGILSVFTKTGGHQKYSDGKERQKQNSTDNVLLKNNIIQEDSEEQSHFCLIMFVLFSGVISVPALLAGTYNTE